MPKKKDGETKKRRGSSTKDARNACTVSPTSGEVLLPPTPSASHLVASNPFDDPPSAMNKPGGAMGLGPHMMLRSPPSMPMNSNGSSPTWGGPHMGPSHRPGNFGSPGGHGWSPNPGDMVPSVYPGMPLQHSPGMSPQSYNYNRPVMIRQSPGAHMPFCGQPRMQATRFGEPGGHMNGERMPVPQGPMNYPMPGTGPMKGMVRLPPAMNQNPVPQMLQTTKKSSSRSESKVSRTDSSGGAPKSKRKSRTSDTKPYSRANSVNECDDKNSKPNLVRAASKTRLTSPSGNRGTPPHALPPVLPQTCTQCCLDIKYPAEDAICCLASCSTWYHRTCAGLTEAAYNCLRSEELALWACDNCLRNKEINSIRLRESAHSELPCPNPEGGVPITGKA